MAAVPPCIPSRTTTSAPAGADVVVLDGMQGGTAATQEVFIENVGQPTLACIRPAVNALQDLNSHREVQLVISGGIRNGADVAKAFATSAPFLIPPEITNCTSR